MCYCGNMGVEWIRNKSQQRKLTLEREKISRRTCRDLNLQPFNHESSALTTDLSLLTVNVLFFSFTSIITTIVSGY